ncbi:MAG TPA: DUF4192 family protein [Kineosporiaceae bacterium]|nr:DUF4192 family protein [Kineosporiaceae bacterium]
MDTNKATVITKAGPEDMIATVWFRLGYKPQSSLIVLGLEGPRQRAGVLLRVDLPSSSPVDRSPEAPRSIDRLPPEALRVVLPEMVRDLLITVAASGAHGVLAIVADEQALNRRPPAVVRLLRRSVRELGLRLVDVLGLTSTGFASLLCRDPRCCPPGGRPISQVLSSRSAAVHVVSGDTVAESEADLLADVTHGPSDPPCDPPSRQWLGPDLGSASGSAGGLPPGQRWLWWERWNEACAAAATMPSRGEPLRGFSAALHDCCLRDAVLMSLLGAALDEVRATLDGDYPWPPSHPGQTAERQPGECDFDSDGFGAGGFSAGGFSAGFGAASADQFHRDLGRLLRSRPDETRLSAGRTVLAGAVRVAGDGDRGPALAVLAMLAWFEGRGGRARLLVERAQADASSVSLTGLVEDLLLERIPPPWLRNGPEG